VWLPLKTMTKRVMCWLASLNVEAIEVRKLMTTLADNFLRWQRMKCVDERLESDSPPTQIPSRGVNTNSHWVWKRFTAFDDCIKVHISAEVVGGAKPSQPIMCRSSGRFKQELNWLLLNDWECWICALLTLNRLLLLLLSPLRWPLQAHNYFRLVWLCDDIKTIAHNYFRLVWLCDVIEAIKRWAELKTLTAVTCSAAIMMRCCMITWNECDLWVPAVLDDESLFHCCIVPVELFTVLLLLLLSSSVFNFGQNVIKKFVEKICRTHDELDTNTIMYVSYLVSLVFCLLFHLRRLSMTSVSLFFFLITFDFYDLIWLFLLTFTRDFD